MAVGATGTFTGTGVSAAMSPVYGRFNLSISGTFSATIQVQRSFDGGLTWLVVDIFTAPVERVGTDIERGVRYRLQCTTFGSGTVTYRLGGADF
jgi:hypothetical protein